MKIQIEVSGDCKKCPCHKIVKDNDYVYHLCMAFCKILDMHIDVLGQITRINRCQECINSENKETVEEELK